MDLARLAAFLVVHKGTKIWMGVQGEEAEERLFEKLLFGCYSVFVVNPSQRELGQEGRKCKACLGDEQVVLLPENLTLYDLPWNGDLDLGTLRWTFEMFQVLFGF